MQNNEKNQPKKPSSEQARPLDFVPGLPENYFKVKNELLNKQKRPADPIPTSTEQEQEDIIKKMYYEYNKPDQLKRSK